MHPYVAPLVLRVLLWLEPNCNAVVVYDAGKWVWDDPLHRVYVISVGDKILTIQEILHLLAGDIPLLVAAKTEAIFLTTNEKGQSQRET
jgi:hypothetical protein